MLVNRQLCHPPYLYPIQVPQEDQRCPLPWIKAASEDPPYTYPNIIQQPPRRCPQPWAKRGLQHPPRLYAPLLPRAAQKCPHIRTMGAPQNLLNLYPVILPTARNWPWAKAELEHPLYPHHIQLPQAAQRGPQPRTKGELQNPVFLYSI